MRCAKCDHELSSDAVFCPMCGSPVAGEKDSLADDIDEALEPTVLLTDVQDEIAPTVLLTPDELEKVSAAADTSTDKAADTAMQQEPSVKNPPADEIAANETELPQRAGISPVIPIAAVIAILIIILIIVLF